MALGLWLVVVLRLVHVSVLSADRWRTEASRQQARSLSLMAERGSLLDRDGRPLAVSAAAWSAWADPQAFTDAKQRARSARQLARVLGVDETTLLGKLSRDREFVWLRRQMPPEGRDAVVRLDMDGVALARESRRLFPNGTMLASVLGFVGTDGGGLEGLEWRLDSHVRGTAGLLVGTRDARGEQVIPAGLTFVAPQRGADVELTFDAVIQQAADRELEIAVRKTGSRSGTVVVMFPLTGEVAALSNYPTYDPNNTPSHPSHLRTNRAVASCYEPGSTLKMFTGIAALEAGVSPAQTFDCGRGSVRVGRSLVKDHASFATLTFGEVIAKSSNVGAIRLGQSAGAARLRDVLDRVGFGRATDCGLPGESAGILRPAREWTPLSLASISFGQEVAVTPVQLLSATCAIASGGVLHQPRVVREVRGRESFRPPVRSPRRVMSEAHARAMADMLEGVVERGTGRAAAVPGYRVAGKTGTAQKVVDGRYATDAHVASFVGWAPARDPVVACIVVLDEPQGPAFHGGDVAAPVFAAIMRDALRHLRIPQDDASHAIGPDVASAGANSAEGEGGHA